MERLNPRIGLLGPFVSRNLGDTAIQAAMIANIRARVPGAQIIGICTEPRDTERTHGIPAVPFTWETSDGQSGLLRWLPWRLRELVQRVIQLRRIYACLGDLDLLIISGGGQLDEFWGGPWRQPYLLYAWTRLARWRRVPSAAFGLGWDYVVSKTARWFCVRAMRNVQFRFFRDEGTLHCLRAAGFSGDALVGPDPAFAIRAGEIASVTARTSPRRFIVVSPIAENAVPPEFRPGHAAHLQELGRACREWLDSGFEIRFVCSQPAMDLPWVAALTDHLPSAQRDRLWTVIPGAGVQEYLREVQGATFVVAARLHGLILAISAGAPVIGITYSRKIGQLLRDCGLESFAVSPEAASAAVLTQTARNLMDNEAALRHTIRTYVERAQGELAVAFTSLLQLLERPAGQQ
ncbi:MAG TPA: polysaccharide pyruvyl transferase family protein [Steroidobacteraceae bacterium]